jgi:hypothetical protein
MKTTLTTLAAALVFGTVANSTELTILNSGSKTGSFSMTSIAYYTDVLKDYDQINLVNPGTRCVALGSLLPRITGPVLMPWASDYEADGRNGGCVTFDIAKGKVLRYNKEPISVCQLNNNIDITKDTGRVGHTVPATGPLSKASGHINDSFDTAHTNVVYDGQGDTRLALLSGEIDYALLTKEHAAYVEANGGTCNYDMSDDSANSLLKLDPSNPNLVFSFDNVWLALNMTDEEAADLKTLLISKHNDCDSASAKYTGCGSLLDIVWTITDEKALKSWELAVESQR